MRKITDNDIVNIAGSVIRGCKVEGVRIKGGDHSDAGYYGVILAREMDSGYYVTWLFHLDEDGAPSTYRTRCFLDLRTAAVKDFNTRECSAKRSALCSV